MRRHYLRIDKICGIAILLIWSSCMCGSPTWADTPSGMTLELFTGQDAGPKYVLGSPIKLIMVLKNVSGGPLNTNHGFRDIELHRFLVITFPDGQKVSLAEAGIASDPPPPIFSDGQAIRTAEVLAGNYVKSVVIEDFAQLAPPLKTTTGRITIEASVPFVRYAWTVNDTQFGLMGVENDPSNWAGTIDAQPVSIEISPKEGTHIQARIWDGSIPGFQAEAKLFDALIAEEDYADAFHDTLNVPDTDRPLQPIAHVYTDTDGIAAFSPKSCLSKPDPGVGYTAIVLYGGAIKGVIYAEEESGWNAGCKGNFSKKIVFGDAPVDYQFSAFAINSFWMRTEAIVRRGHVGVSGTCNPCLKNKVEVLIDSQAQIVQGTVYGDRVSILHHARVGDVSYNTLFNKGTISGQEITPLQIPAAWDLPPFSHCDETVLDAADLIVDTKQQIELKPGVYGEVVVHFKGQLKLTGGAYHFKSLRLFQRAAVLCEGPADIHILERLYPGAFATIGPATTDVTAADIVFYVQGVNGKSGNLTASPKAAVLGVRSQVKANVYVPNGTLWLLKGSTLEGSLIALDVIVGVKAELVLNSPFKSFRTNGFPFSNITGLQRR